MRSSLKPSWIVIALAALVVTAGPALARSKHRPPPRCVDHYVEFSWYDFLFGGGPDPHPNGCSPPVFTGQRFIGQDPDPFIRYGLERDPDSGYANIEQR